MLLMPQVCPSGGDFAAASSPIVEEPPGRFSTTTDCPRSSLNRGASMRNTTSVEPPGAYGTMIRTGRVGKFCASVTAGQKNRVANAATETRGNVEFIVPSSSFSIVNRQGQTQIQPRNPTETHRISKKTQPVSSK